MTDTAERPTRGCEVCGGVDTHPRHQQWIPQTHPQSEVNSEILQKLLDNKVSAQSLLEIQDPNSSCHHLDCGMSVGCPDCTTYLADLGEDVRREKLVKHVEAQVAKLDSERKSA